MPCCLSRRQTLAALLGAQSILRAGGLPPIRAITRGPKYHWFGYYDKLQFDPSSRYVLGMEVDFEHRSPRPDDVIRLGSWPRPAGSRIPTMIRPAPSIGSITCFTPRMVRDSSSSTAGVAKRRATALVLACSPLTPKDRISLCSIRTAKHPISSGGIPAMSSPELGIHQNNSSFICLRTGPKTWRPSART